MYKLRLAALSLLLVTSLAPAAWADGPDVPGMSHEADSIGDPTVKFFVEQLCAGEAYLKNGQVDRASSAAVGLTEGFKVTSVYVANYDRRYLERLGSLRTGILLAGGNVGTYDAWLRDGLKFDGVDQWYQASEQHLADLWADENSETRDDIQQWDKDFDYLNRLMASETFKSNAALVAYTKQWLVPNLQGIQKRNDGLEAHHMVEEFKTASNVAKARNPDYVKEGREDAELALFHYQRIKSHQFDTAGYQVSMGDGNDPLAPKLSLDQVAQQLNGILASLNSRESKIKAENATDLAAWKRLIKNDKARLYAEYGWPESWDGPNTIQGGVKASWWVYRMSSPLQGCVERHVYYFDANQKLVKEQKQTVADQ